MRRSHDQALDEPWIDLLPPDPEAREQPVDDVGQLELVNDVIELG